VVKRILNYLANARWAAFKAALIFLSTSFDHKLKYFTTWQNTLPNDTTSWICKFYVKSTKNQYFNIYPCYPNLLTLKNPVKNISESSLKNLDKKSIF
jgi:hypothetical protein